MTFSKERRAKLHSTESNRASQRRNQATHQGRSFRTTKPSPARRRTAARTEWRMAVQRARQL